MLNIYIYVALSIVILSGAAGAVPLEEWNRTYGDTGEDVLSDLRQTADGGYIISGSTCLNRTVPCEGLLIKTDAKGNVEWKRTYIGSTRYVRQTMDGGYIAAGSIVDPASGHLDAWLIRTDADGSELWSKQYGEPGNEYATSFQRTPDGGYLLNIWGGSSLVKTDANGNGLWNRTIKPAAGYPNYVLQSRDGGYVMTGSIGDGAYWLDAWLARTDADFNIQFSRQFRESKPWNSVSSVIETSDDGYLMIVDANLRATSDDNYEMWLIRTDKNGSKLWSRKFEGAREGSVQQTLDGGYIFGSTRFSAEGSAVRLTKFESDVNFSSPPLSTPVYSPGELRNCTEIPVKYRNDINEGDIKAVLDAASREIKTFDGR